jgi:hypothetical protein
MNAYGTDPLQRIYAKVAALANTISDRLSDEHRDSHAVLEQTHAELERLLDVIEAEQAAQPKPATGRTFLGPINAPGSHFGIGDIHNP